MKRGGVRRQPRSRPGRDEMKPEAHPQDREREATPRRFPLALFVVAELLCTGALVASLVLWG